MLYIHEPTETYPCNDRSIRDMNPNVTFPAIITPDIAASFGYFPVTDIDPPTITSTQRLGQGKPHKREDGAWYQTWVIQDISAEEVAALVAGEKVAACARLNAKRDAIQYGAFTDSHGHAYDVDSKGREKMTGLEAKIANGLTLPEGFTWTGADNAERPHTNASFLALTTEILLWTSTVHGVCVAAKAAIRDEAVTTMDQVSAIEAGVVWP